MWKEVFGKHTMTMGGCRCGTTTHYYCLHLSTKKPENILMHPHSKHWNPIDYILLQQCDLRNVLYTRVMPSEEPHTFCGLDHCKLKLHLKPRPKQEGSQRESSKLAALSHLKGKLTSSQAYSWGHWFICWNTLGLITLQFCRLLKKSLGSQQRRTKDETNEKIQELLAIKRSVHQAHLAQMSPCEESHLLSCMQQPPAQTK